MIDEIRLLAAPAFLPCTQRCDVSEVIDGDDLVMLDCEAVPPSLIWEDRDKAVFTVRPASEDELSTVLAWVRTTPPHPGAISPSECLERFTDVEQDAIEALYPRFARQLFSATADIPWERYADAVEALTTARILTEESRTRHLGARK